LQDYIDNIVDLINKNNCKESALLCGASILTESKNIKGYEGMKEKVEKIFINKSDLGFENLNFNELNPLEKRSIGSMIGMGIGDVYGALYEFKNVDVDLYNADNYSREFASNEDWKWNNNKTFCGWTDDSSMGFVSG
jgi:hypothetical protein